MYYALPMPGSDRFLLLSLVLVLLVSYDLADASIARMSPESSVLPDAAPVGRERISINTDWRFQRSLTNQDKLIYDKRPDTTGDLTVLKPWILPAMNDFVNSAAKRKQRPAGDAPGADVPFTQKSFDDSGWEALNLPHDWAVKGPFYDPSTSPISGGMGRLPIQGIAWYRRKLAFASVDQGKTIFLDIDGAQSYAMVWLNGNLVGGWPYGYNSFRLDLTPYVKIGEDNQLAIRIENPVASSRWYPGGGIYRNVWLTKLNPTHVGQYGTFITTRDVSAQSASIDLTVQIENKGSASQQVDVATDIYVYDSKARSMGQKVAEFPRSTVSVAASQKQATNGTVKVQNPQLWGPPPSQKPNLYVAVTRLSVDNQTIDTYETSFGIRSINYDPTKGLLVNGEHIRIQGVCNHHDLGALGAAVNYRALERQMQILRDFGTNAIRTSHNPPTPELLELADQMGFLVLDEIFDCWKRSKNSNDFHLIFDDWSEADLRSFIRRDRNHPSVFAWSIGNEISEQGQGETGAAITRQLRDIAHEEDPTRGATAAMNSAKGDSPFAAALDIIGINYQGEYSTSEYPDFHSKLPNKMIMATETASTLSSRGTYLFPVTDSQSQAVSDSAGGGGDPKGLRVSAYELYAPSWGASGDRVFATQDKYPYVAGEFVWTGFDYIGEPTPYDNKAKSSYFGIVDLAGFRKDRFYLYQARWRPELKQAHILPHWNWPDRVGAVTPVHVFSGADEAELFLNGQSQGRIKKAASNFRFRWDKITYQSGELSVVTYKNGEIWANETVRTTEAPSQLKLVPDRANIKADGNDLSFVTLQIVDSKGDVVPTANNQVTFSVSGPGEIVATDNGDPADFTAFPSKQRKALSGLALAIVRGKAGSPGSVVVSASASGLAAAQVTITTT